MPARAERRAGTQGCILNVGRLRPWVPDIALSLGTSPRAGAQFRDDTYPRSPGAVSCCVRRCLRRDVDGPIRRLTWQRPAPGRRANGSRSRRPAVTVAVEASAMARAYSDRRRGTWPPSSKGQTGRRFAAGHKSPSRGRRKAAPGPEQGLREPDGVPRMACRGLPGRFGPGPGLPTRHPRTRRTPLMGAGDGRRVPAVQSPHSA
jgi:hypothetical protein